MIKLSVKSVEVFKHRMQLYRHLEKEHPDKFEKQKANKKLPYTGENGMFKCTTCSKLLKHKTNMYRHKCLDSSVEKKTCL